MAGFLPVLRGLQQLSFDQLPLYLLGVKAVAQLLPEDRGID